MTQSFEIGSFLRSLFFTEFFEEPCVTSHGVLSMEKNFICGYFIAGSNVEGSVAREKCLPLSLIDPFLLQ